MSTARKKDDAERVLNAFRGLVKALRLADRAGLKVHGLGAAQVFVLHELNRESPLSVNNLAERTATDQSTVSVVVNKLVEKGLVERVRSQTDARRTELSLTTRGRHLMRRLPPPVQQTVMAAVRLMSPARARALADMLEQIVSHLGVSDEFPPMFFEDSTADESDSASRQRR
ncbi:MAG: MarR family transcriptional regulator [Thermoanaerobaculia bacterium]